MVCNLKVWAYLLHLTSVFIPTSHFSSFLPSSVPPFPNHTDGRSMYGLINTTNTNQALDHWTIAISSSFLVQISANYFNLWIRCATSNQSSYCISITFVDSVVKSFSFIISFRLRPLPSSLSTWDWSLRPMWWEMWLLLVVFWHPWTLVINGHTL